MSKQTPRTILWPDNGATRALTKVLTDVFRRVRNDLDNGATTFTKVTIAGKANLAVADFDDGQKKLVQDTSDSNEVFSVVRYGDKLYYEELTQL